MDTAQKNEKETADLQKSLTEALMKAGALKVGFGDLTSLPETPGSAMPRGISIAVPLDLKAVNRLSTGMTYAYFAEYNRANTLLDFLASLAADLLQAHGYDAIPMTVKSVKQSFQGHSTVLPHKTVATRAGMGWIGRSGLLVTKERGSAVRITSVLTNALFSCAEPVNESSCGTCGMCVRNCPGQAPLGPAWSVNSSREDFIDILACRKTCVERSWPVAPGMSMCSLCVLVCPWTQKAIEEEGLAYGFPAAQIAQRSDLQEILALQKLAFRSEANRSNDCTIKPLTQTIEDLTEEFSNPRRAVIFLKIVQDRRIVGSVRAYEKDGTCYICRLIVHPEYQRKGLGRKLMAAIETCFINARFELFTRSDIAGNVRFYESLGYKVFDTRKVSENFTFVYLEKNS